MNSEILEALTQITKEKNLDIDYVIGTLEAGLLSAAKKKFGFSDNISVKLDRKSGQIKMFATKKVVEKVTDPLTEIPLAEAQEIDKKSQLDGEVKVELNFEVFGRNAIATAKQILIQKIRDAERDKVYEDFKDRVGEIVSGSVQQIDKGNIIVNLGRAEGIIPLKEQIPKEKYRQGERIRAYVVSVEKTYKGPQILLSRTHPGFLERLFALEVPEIFEKIIEIKAIAREPGERSKIAVYSIDERIDPVGACVGVKGTRVQGIVRELSNERIDILPWSSDPETFVSRALSPAKIIQIETHPDENKMTVVVEDDKLSLSIGKSGQNVRLAAQLTGWKINILSESDYKTARKKVSGPKINLKELSGIGKKLEEKLSQAGFDSIQALAESTPESLSEVEGIGPKKAATLIQAAQKYLGHAREPENKVTEKSE